ncbi:MAG: hypothetical protein KJO34_01240 [Deltaproteobacteria bacterium]|nr:hypothetical protein [Deltaproteobacteria bacterium]
MKGEKLFVICFMLLIFSASFASSSRADENLNSIKIAANEDNTSSECGSNQSIPCNWKGWKNSFAGVSCPRWPCDRYHQVLGMKCMDGFLSEVSVVKICMACQESPSP